METEFKAQVLTCAAFYGDQRAASQFGITDRTVRSYRQQLATDGELATMFNELRQEALQNWTRDIPAAIQAGVSFLKRASNEIEITPESIHAVAGAVKLLSEIQIFKEFVNAKIEQEREDNLLEYNYD